MKKILALCFVAALALVGFAMAEPVISDIFAMEAAAEAAAGAGSVTFAIGAMGVMSQDYYRYVYELVKEKLSISNPAQFENWKIQEGFLRSDVILSNNASTLNFDIIAGNTGRVLYPGEQLLNRTDSFFVVEMGILFGYEDAQGRRFLFSHPSQAIQDATGNTVADLNFLYDGKLNITAGRLEVRSNADVRQFLEVPEIQAGATPAGTCLVDAACSETIAALLKDSGSALNALRKVYPQTIYNGSDTIKIEVNYPTRAAMAVAAVIGNTKVFASLYHRGFFARGINVNA